MSTEFLFFQSFLLNEKNIEIRNKEMNLDSTTEHRKAKSSKEKKEKKEREKKKLNHQIFGIHSHREA